MEAKKAKTSLQTQSRMGGSRSCRVACLAEKRRVLKVIETIDCNYNNKRCIARKLWQVLMGHIIITDINQLNIYIYKYIYIIYHRGSTSNVFVFKLNPNVVNILRNGRARERAQTVTLKNSEWQCEAHTNRCHLPCV